ncbi:MAG: hypothetical protein E6H75_09235 [Betaproteobacteria bacterium]|nr:MAG: hypothetical protein E6H75_09235 [Betaproteobacteria bacterium]TMG77679.1 MAG: hypothetical protein E6H80_00530 [Betaproteobacteria bacterium]
MYSDLVIIFNFIISQWSLSPQAFKDAVLAAALAKAVLAVIWWTTRVLVAKFPSNLALSAFQKLLNTRPAKLVVLVLDVTLIDVFLFFAGVALLDLHRGFSIFSLWTAALFSFLFAYMVMVAHSDIKKY